MQRNFEIIATINTQNAEPPIIRSFLAAGATIFRLNGAFLKPAELPAVSKAIAGVAKGRTKILLDLPGYKIRFLYLDKTIHLQRGDEVTLKRSCFNHPGFIEATKLGTVIGYNNGFSTLIVKRHSSACIVCRAETGGIIVKGKGLHLRNVSYRPQAHALTRFDIALIDAAKKSAIDYVGLSFAHSKGDIEYLKERLDGSRIECIPKIEAKESVRNPNLSSIADGSKLVILDRGDLAGEIGLEHVWKVEQRVIRTCHLYGARVILATQVLSSMEKNPLPTIAEVNSLYQALHRGIDGVQLSEETTVGLHAAGAIRFASDAARASHRFASAQPVRRKGKVFWLMGPTSCGKTTIAKEVLRLLRSCGIKVLHFDGDEVRDMLGPRHGFSKEDRLQVVKNLVALARKASDEGIDSIVSALTAHEEARAYVRRSLPEVVSVFLECSIDECARRDPKGLYKMARDGKISTLIGVHEPYRVPRFADLTINTEKVSLREAARLLIDYMASGDLLTHG